MCNLQSETLRGKLLHKQRKNNKQARAVWYVCQVWSPPNYSKRRNPYWLGKISRQTVTEIFLSITVSQNQKTWIYSTIWRKSRNLPTGQVACQTLTSLSCLTVVICFMRTASRSGTATHVQFAAQRLVSIAGVFLTVLIARNPSQSLCPLTKLTLTQLQEVEALLILLCLWKI